MSVVVSGVEDLDVGFCHVGFLSEFLAQELFGCVKVSVEEPADESYGEHVAALEHGLVVHSGVGEAVLDHLGDGGCDDVLLDAELLDGVVGREFCLVKVGLLEAVGVDDDACGLLGELVLCLERCGVHGNEHVAEVAGGEDLVGSHVYLETGDARKAALRGADVCRIIGERTNVIADCC